jgi:ribokinase
MSPLVAVVGSINLDYTVRVEQLPNPGETVLGGQATRGLGGKGANQALAVAQLLGASRMIGAVGDDPDGMWLLDRLADFGVDISTVVRDDAHPSGVALIGVDAHGENSIIVAPGANGHVIVPPDSTAGADALLLQFEVPLQTATRAAIEFDGYVAVNPSPAQPIPPALLERADLFVVNEGEYRDLPELQDVALVAVTRGSRGADLLRRGHVTHHADAVPVAHVANTVGAGDAFFAALASAVVLGTSTNRALDLACTVAAAVVAAPTSQARLSRLDDYLRHAS